MEPKQRKRHALPRDEITPEIVRADLAYDPLAGTFTWKARRVGVRHGATVGAVNKYGYVVIPLRRVQFHAHRLAWAHYFGEFPTGQIDHINGDGTDNRIANLRLASPSQNKANTSVQRNNTHGLKGVFWNKKDATWVARIQKSGKRLFLGSFATKEAAAAAYDKACIEVFGEYGRGNNADAKPDT